MIYDIDGNLIYNEATIYRMAQTDMFIKTMLKNNISARTIFNSEILTDEALQKDYITLLVV